MDGAIISISGLQIFFYVGAPGVVVAVIFRWTVRDPVRGAHDAPGARAGDDSLRVVLRYLATRRSFIFIVASAMLHGFSSYGTSYWAIVELMAVIDLFSGFNNLLKGLQVEPDEKPWYG